MTPHFDSPSSPKLLLSITACLVSAMPVRVSMMQGEPVRKRLMQLKSCYKCTPAGMFAILKILSDKQHVGSCSCMHMVFPHRCMLKLAAGVGQLTY